MKREHQIILIEAAQAMQASGATVRLFTLADDADYGNLAERCRLPVLKFTKTLMIWKEFIMKSGLSVYDTLTHGEGGLTFMEDAVNN